ncbi:MAG: sugar ABC transporter ATP-binding protein [Armatimonadetes bacterium]|nr:sugar ABC transporter ATP-binding protein [Armatimonadota bacterium]
MRVERLTRKGFFRDLSFHIRAGEIVGIGGLAGAGRSEMARSLCGIDPCDSGDIFLKGRPARWRSYREAIRSGFAYLTEDRKGDGLALRLCLGENALSAALPQHCRGLFYSPRKGKGVLSQLIEGLKVHPPVPSAATASLSGGNQQKVLLAKWLATGPKVLVLDEPTRGVDVGAKAMLHKAIAELADRGKSVLLISSGLPELVPLSDRILIMRKGRFVAEMKREDCTEEAVLLAANGEGQAS